MIPCRSYNYIERIPCSRTPFSPVNNAVASKSDSDIIHQYRRFVLMTPDMSVCHCAQLVEVIATLNAFYKLEEQLPEVIRLTSISGEQQHTYTVLNYSAASIELGRVGSQQMVMTISRFCEETKTSQTISSFENCDEIGCSIVIPGPHPTSFEVYDLIGNILSLNPYKRVSYHICDLTNKSWRHIKDFGAPIPRLPFGFHDYLSYYRVPFFVADLFCGLDTISLNEDEQVKSDARFDYLLYHIRKEGLEFQDPEMTKAGDLSAWNFTKAIVELSPKSNRETTFRLSYTDPEKIEQFSFTAECPPCSEFIFIIEIDTTQWPPSFHVILTNYGSDKIDYKILNCKKGREEQMKCGYSFADINVMGIYGFSPEAINRLLRACNIYKIDQIYFMHIKKKEIEDKESIELLYNIFGENVRNHEEIFLYGFDYRVFHALTVLTDHNRIEPSHKNNFEGERKQAAVENSSRVLSFKHIGTQLDKHPYTVIIKHQAAVIAKDGEALLTLPLLENTSEDVIRLIRNLTKRIISIVYPDFSRAMLATRILGVPTSVESSDTTMICLFERTQKGSVYGAAAVINEEGVITELDDTKNIEKEWRSKKEGNTLTKMQPTVTLAGKNPALTLTKVQFLDSKIAGFFHDRSFTLPLVDLSDRNLGLYSTNFANALNVIPGVVNSHYIVERKRKRLEAAARLIAEHIHPNLVVDYLWYITPLQSQVTFLDSDVL